MKKIIVISIILILMILLVYVSTDKAPEIVTMRPEYSLNEEIKLSTFMTDSIAGISDDRTSNEKLETTLLKNGVVVEKPEDEMLDISKKNDYKFTIIVDDGIKKTTEILTYDVKKE